MAVRVRKAIRDLGQAQERRIREKQGEVEAGDMPHWRQEALLAMIERARKNIEELAGLARSTEGEADAALSKAADLANIGMFVALRLQAGDRVPAL